MNNIWVIQKYSSFIDILFMKCIEWKICPVPCWIECLSYKYCCRIDQEISFLNIERYLYKKMYDKISVYKIYYWSSKEISKKSVLVFYGNLKKACWNFNSQMHTSCIILYSVALLQTNVVWLGISMYIVFLKKIPLILESSEWK